MTTRGENPFCAARIRPGAMPFLFSESQCAPKLLQRLERSGWQGQIVGPHGSGKSSLIAAIVPALKAAGRDVRLVILHDGQRRLPKTFFQASVPPGALVIVDGYEQLGCLERFKLRRYCRRCGLGLVVTAHCSVGFPEIFRSAPTLEAAQRIVTELQRGYPAYVTAEDVADAFARQGADLRELLFDLYDLYRKRKISALPDGKLS